MRYAIIKGATARLRATVYTDDGVTAANIAGASITIIFKKNARDLDSAALFSITPTVLSAGDGTIEGELTAAQTNDLSYPVLYFEIIAKLSGGSFIRSGEQELRLCTNVLKVLY